MEQQMNYPTLTVTPHNTKRVFVPRSTIDKLNPTQIAALQVVLGAWSIWGDCDSRTEEYLSWEFELEMPDMQIKRTISRLIPESSIS